MLDMRYHWLSLAALFLTLGLGILIGAGLGEGGAIPREQARLADQLEAGLARLRDENRTLRQAAEGLERELQDFQAAVDMLARASIAGRLAGRSFVLVVPESPGVAATADVDGSMRASPLKEADESPVDPVARWQALLERAGATVVRRPVPPGAVLTVEEGDEAAEASEASAQSVMAVYINPGSNLPIPDGWRGAVLWDEAGARGGPQGKEGVRGRAGVGSVLDGILGGRGEAVLPSDWLVLRAGEGPLSEWALVEGLRHGWQGFLDASTPNERLHTRLATLVETGAGGS